MMIFFFPLSFGLVAGRIGELEFSYERTCGQAQTRPLYFGFLFFNAIPMGIQAIAQILTRNKVKLELGLLGYEELRFFMVIF
jgi:hypothetical protein